MVNYLPAILCILVICGGPLMYSMVLCVDTAYNGFGYESLVSRMEHLENKISKQQIEIENLNELIVRNQEHLLTFLESKFLKQELETEKLNDKIGQTQHLVEDKIEKIDKQNDQILRNKNLVDRVLERNFASFLDTINTISFKSCKDAPKKSSGKYLLHPFGDEQKFQGYCEQEKYEGGWLVIQHRYDGSVDFYRNWTEYQKGFGEIDGEFWLGLDKIHRLTKGRNHTLMIEIKDFEDNYAFARYDGFELGDEKEFYALKTLGPYSGTAGDSLKTHKGMTFSTYDKDNDSSDNANCAESYTGAWWYSACLASNLNGLYSKDNVAKSIIWYYLKNKMVALKFSRIMIREM